MLNKKIGVLKSKNDDKREFKELLEVTNLLRK